MISCLQTSKKKEKMRKIEQKHAGRGATTARGVHPNPQES
jgi:hypothetical protein